MFFKINVESVISQLHSQWKDEICSSTYPSLELNNSQKAENPKVEWAKIHETSEQFLKESKVAILQANEKEKGVTIKLRSKQKKIDNRWTHQSSHPLPKINKSPRQTGDWSHCTASYRTIISKIHKNEKKNLSHSYVSYSLKLAYTIIIFS